MIIKSSAGTEHVRAEYTITRDINGIPTLETDYFQPIHHHVDPIQVHIKDSDDVYIVVINESDTVVDSSRVKLTAVHSLIYDFTGSRIYEKITQHFSIEGILSVVFDDTDYDFEVAGDRQYYAMQFQNFGGAKTRLELLNQICDRWECEYDVVGNMVYIKDKVGAKDTENKKFRYLMNINDSKVEFDITEGATYIKGYFGKEPEEDDEETENTYFELDYTHQLANQYGIRHAEPYSNENITTTETAEQYLKNRLENTWRLSIDIDVVELESSTNSEYFLGDVVWAIDERIDIDMQTRIIKIVKTYDIDDRLLSTNVTLGNKSFVDYVMGSTAGTSEFVTLEDLERETLTIEEEIVRKMAEFDNAFNLARDQMRAEYNQAYANALAEIEALDEKMATEIATEIANFETEFNAEVQAAKDLAEQQIADTEQRINTTIDTARIEMETEFNAEVERIEQEALAEYDRISSEITDSIDQARSEIENDYTQAVTNAREYAEQQAQEKADAVRTDLEMVTSGHQSMLEDLENNVMSIDDFLGDSREVTLDQRFQNITMNFEERIRNIDSTHYNIIRGTSFDNPELFQNHSSVEIITNEIDNFARLGLGTTNIPYVMNAEYFDVEAGQKYNLIFTYRTNDVPEIDYIRLRPSSGSYGGDLVINELIPDDLETSMSGQWTKKVVSFISDRDMPVRLLLGTNFGAMNTQRGILDIKKIYLTTTNNREWLPHPDDDSQNVSEIVRRVTFLEDGRSELITRSEYDFDTGQLDQYIKSVEDTVEGNKMVLQRVDDWQATNGASIEETIYGFDQKVWLNDVANIGANLIPQSANAWESGGLWIANGGESGSLQNIRMKERIEIQPSTTYTLSSNSTYISAIERVDIHQYLTTGGWINRHAIPRNGEVTFTTWGTAGTVRITLVAMEGFSIHPRFIDHPDGIIKLKLEVGDKATPMLNAISRIEQIADEIAIRVQEIDGEYLAQSDITVSPSSVRIGSTEILGDSVLSSILNVSPNAIDMITQKMRLSGDLYVDGDITSLAITAIEGNFSRLFASEISTVNLNASNITTGTLSSARLRVDNALINRLIANSILTDEMTSRSITAINGRFGTLFAGAISTVDLNASNIKTGTLASERLRVDNALINRLVANSILTGEMTSRSVTAINANFGTLFASAISTVDLNASNISTGTMSSARLQVNNALINRLISNSILTSEMRTQSLSAVNAEIGDLRTKILTSDVIKSTHLSSSNAMIDKMFANSSLISRLTSKSAFISNIRAIDLTADQVRVGFNGISSNVTINSSGITIDNGALTVNRDDGGAPTIIKGYNPSGVSLYPSTPNRREGVYNIEGQYATRSSNTGSYAIYDFYMFEHFYTDLMLDFVITNLSSSSINVQVRIRGTDGSTFGWNVIYNDIPPGTAIFPRTIRNIGIPRGTQERFFVETRTLTKHGKFGIHTYMVKHLDNGHGYPRLEHNGKV